MTAEVNGVETSRGRWSDAQFSFGEMVARASADVRLRPGDLLGSGTVGDRLPARGPGRDARPVPRARRRGRRSRIERLGDAPDADRGAAAMTADRRGGAARRRRRCPTGSTRRASSSTSTWPRRTRGGCRGARRGASLRPHVKTHKSVALARLQLDHAASRSQTAPRRPFRRGRRDLTNYVCPVVEQFDDFVVARNGVGGRPLAGRRAGAEPMTERIRSGR